jgi:hypothetical protein
MKTTYRDLPIHQRITAKGNKVAFARKIESLRSDLLKRIVKADPAINLPMHPFYLITFKTNYYESEAGN